MSLEIPIPGTYVAESAAMRWDAYRGSDALVYPATLAYYDSEPGTKLWGLSRTERSAAMFAAGWTHFAVIGK